MTVKHCLAEIPSYTVLEKFFRSTLSILDAAFDDFLAELKGEKLKPEADCTKIQDIYKLLWQECEKDPDKIELLR